MVFTIHVINYCNYILREENCSEYSQTCVLCMKVIQLTGTTRLRKLKSVIDHTAPILLL